MTTPPYIKPRFWEWKGQEGNRPGIGLFRGAELKAHLTPDQARALADKLHDMADQIDARQETNT